eukprot:6651363-Lingulodinium_polyedra.AAC.1
MDLLVAASSGSGAAKGERRRSTTTKAVADITNVADHDLLRFQEECLEKIIGKCKQRFKLTMAVKAFIE